MPYINYQETDEGLFNKIIKYLNLIFYRIIDLIANGVVYEKHLYQRYILLGTLVSIIYLINQIIITFNPFEIKDTKNHTAINMFLILISTLIFLFFLYRNTKKREILSIDGEVANSQSISNLTKNYYTDNIKKLIEYTDDKDYKIKKENLEKSISSPLFKLLKYVVFLFIIIVFPMIIINIYYYYLGRNSDWFDYTYFVVGFLLFSTVLSIILILKDYFFNKLNINTQDKKEDNIFKKSLNLIINIILFIPCLIVIFSKDVHDDIKSTPSSVYIVFFILIFIVTLIFIIPKLLEYIILSNDGDVLRGKGPFYLNQYKVLGNYQNLNNVNIRKNNVPIPKFDLDKEKAKNDNNTLVNLLGLDQKKLNKIYKNIGIDRIYDNLDKNDPFIIDKSFDKKIFDEDLFDKYNVNVKYDPDTINNKKFSYSYEYSISFYIYINPQPNNTSVAYTEDTELFNYGNKPVIYYNGKNRNFIIKSEVLNENGVEMVTIYSDKNIKLQKWINFIVNYKNNTINIFMDGKVIASQNNVAPFFRENLVSIGKDNGVHGSIKDIYYYTSIRTPNQTKFIIDQFMKNKPKVEID